MTDWTKGLNPEQREAVLHEAGPLLILAGAGSGKTTVLVSRTGNLLERGIVRAKNMCVLTFTNKAARELKHRVGHKLGHGPLAKEAGELWTGTFHSFGLQILRQNAKLAGLPSSFGIIDQSDAIALVKELMSTIKNSAKESFKTETLLSMMSQWRERGQTRAKNEADEYETMAQVVLPKYLKRLEHLGVTDFDGLLLKPLELFKQHPEVLEKMQSRFQQVMVDEFQDTNKTQFQLVMGLSQHHENLTVVGDDDQSIYGWRGARIENILDFPKQFKKCEVIRLERNYRSTPSILSLANQVIAKNTDRHGKVLRPDPKAEAGPLPECFIYDTDDIEAQEVITHINHFRDQGFTLGDIAILYRSNGQGGLLESQLRQNRIEYTITGGVGFFDRKETRDVLAYLRCSILPNEVAYRRIINTPTRGVGETTIDRITEFSSANSLSFVNTARKWVEAEISPKAGGGIDELFEILKTLPEEILGTVPLSPPRVQGIPNAQVPKTYGERLVRKFQDIGYRDHVRNTCKDLDSFNKRWAVMDIFGRVLDSFIEKGGATRDSLQDFCDAMELRHTEEENKEETPKVQLLTLHASKGLEFPVVILIGVEEDLLPHKTLGSDVSEERRLFYVGVTRAKQHLVLTRSRTRKRHGRYGPVAPSRFLVEVPLGAIEMFESGTRPVTAEVKQNKLADLMKSLEGKIASQKIDTNRGAPGSAPQKPPGKI